MKARRALLALALLTTIAAKKTEPGAPVEAISRGDADGAYNVVIDDAGRLRVAYVTRDGEPPGEPELRFREQTRPGVWGGDERVMLGAPDDLKLAVGGQPALVYRLGGALNVTERGADGTWKARELVAAGDAPARFQVLGGPETRRLVVGTQRGGTTRIRRQGLAIEAVVSELELPRVATEMDFAASEDGEHIVYQYTTGVLRAPDKGAKDATPKLTSTLAYTRLTRTTLPSFLIGQSRDAITLAITTLHGEPIIAWLSQRDGRTRLHVMLRGLGRFALPEVLLDTDKTVEGLTLAASGGIVIVATIHDHKLVSRRLENQFWSEWSSPPGIERSSEHAPTAVIALLDGNDGVHLLTHELTVGQLKRRRIVEWIAPAGTVLMITR